MNPPATRTLWKCGTSALVAGFVAFAAALGPEEARAHSVTTQTDADGGGVTYNETAGGGGGKNIVIVQNRTNGRLATRANIQLNRIPGPTVEPVNLADGTSSCADCQTLSVALQINLTSRTANVVTPQNAAVAVNAGCTRCVTVARALQYVYSVDDPTKVPPEVSALIRKMERTLIEVHTDPRIRLPEAEERINAVIAEFSGLADSLDDRRDEKADTGGAEPPATVTPAPGTTATPTPTAVSSPDPGPTSTPAATTTTVSDAPATPSATPVPPQTATPTPAGPASTSQSTPTTLASPTGTAQLPQSPSATPVP
jgi:hypothetical protein